MLQVLCIATQNTHKFLLTKMSSLDASTMDLSCRCNVATFNESGLPIMHYYHSMFVHPPTLKISKWCHSSSSLNLGLKIMLFYCIILQHSQATFASWNLWDNPQPKQKFYLQWNDTKFRNSCAFLKPTIARTLSTTLIGHQHMNTDGELV